MASCFGVSIGSLFTALGFLGGLGFLGFTSGFISGIGSIILGVSTFFVNRFYKVVFSVADPHPHSDSLVRGADTDPYQNVTDCNTGSVYAVVYNWVNLLLIR